MNDVIFINAELQIPLSELDFRFSRSGGPGGQHVNRTETRVELLFDVAQSASLTDAQRERLLKKLASKLDQNGVLHIISSATRSQTDNREDVIARFEHLLRRALAPEKPRLPTRPTRAARQERLNEKRKRSQQKTWRRQVPRDE